MQDQRKVSESLTVNHKRVLYVLEDTVENRRLRGHTVTAVYVGLLYSKGMPCWLTRPCRNTHLRC